MKSNELFIFLHQSILKNVKPVNAIVYDVNIIFNFEPIIFADAEEF